ncbi:hypothetical protein BDZ97DRAFT_1896381 [Flammula alnicola]|nr:hypothetical protein BDZ97DRAFT_1896381 [Flammula alnicola]
MDPTSRQLPHPASQKPRIRDFEANLPLPSTAIPRPSNFAINKLRELEYVELYYFTPEGLAEAITYDHSATHDALTFAQIDGTIVLCPSSTSNPSPNAVPDDVLTWRQMTIAKTTLLRCMANTGWANNYIAALNKFYTCLEAHQTRFEPEGEASLLQYQAEVRREWHDALDPSRPGLAFDISQINEDRITTTMANILNRKHAANVLRLVNHHSA